MVDPATLRTRRIVGTGVLLAIAVGAAFGGHRGTHALQNLVVPGVGLIEVSWWLAAATFVLLVGGLVLWLRWGADWVPLTSIVLSTVGAALLSSAGHGTPATMAATHEFPVVALLVSALTWLASAWRSLPWIGSFRKRPVAPRPASDLPPQERCQLVVLHSLAADRHDDDARADAALIDVNSLTPADDLSQIARTAKTTAVLLLTNGTGTERAYLEAGASGMISKGESGARLVEAIHAVTAGYCVNPGRADERLVVERPQSAGQQLSEREEQVLRQISCGLTHSQIATRLRISPHTVDTHRRKLMEKLEVHNVVDLVKFAIRQGLVTV